MFDTSIVEVDLHDIHDMGHLSEDQDSMIELFEFWQDSVEEFKLSWTSENPIMVGDVIVIFQEKIRMVAAFSKLHHEIGQGSCADLARIVVEF